MAAQVRFRDKPHVPAVVGVIGVLRKILGQGGKVFSTFQAVVDHLDFSARFHIAAGFAFLYLRQFRQAEISLDRAVALNPNDPFILSIRALFLNYTDRPDEAVVEIAEAQRRDPYAVGWYDDFRGIILTTAGRYSEAIACYAKMAAVPRWSLVRLIVCHSELGEIKQAQDVLAKVKAHYPGLRLDEIVDAEVDFYEDPAVCSHYRAILGRVDRQE